MAFHHHHEPMIERRTVSEGTDDSFSGALVAVLAIVVILFLIWAIFLVAE